MGNKKKCYSSWKAWSHVVIFSNYHNREECRRLNGLWSGMMGHFKKQTARTLCMLMLYIADAVNSRCWYLMWRLQVEKEGVGSPSLLSLPQALPADSNRTYVPLRACGTFSKVDRMRGHKTSLKTFKRWKSYQYISWSQWNESRNQEQAENWKLTQIYGNETAH